jgi:hypothetical protein
MNSELWRIVASGLIDSLLAEYVAVTNRDARTILEQRGCFLGVMHKLCYISLGYVPTSMSVMNAMSFIQDKEYDPKIVYIYPRPTGAKVTNGKLVCDTPPTGYVAHVFSWNYTNFIYVGLLSEHDNPGVGVYVISLKPDGIEDYGPPSAFLTIGA